MGGSEAALYLSDLVLQFVLVELDAVLQERGGHGLTEAPADGLQQPRSPRLLGAQAWPPTVTALFMERALSHAPQGASGAWLRAGRQQRRSKNRWKT